MDAQSAKETTVIFDLDGTLVDSAPDIAACLAPLLDEAGLDPIPVEEMKYFIGDGVERLFELAFIRNNLPTPDSATLKSYVARFIERYSANLAVKSRPFPEVTQTLEALKSAGLGLAICTNKRTSLAEPLLEAMGLTAHFNAIICRDTLPVRKPHPAPLLEACLRSGRAYGIMVGDTLIDLTAAQAASMPCALATFGYGRFTATDIKKARPFGHFAELPGIISEFLDQA